MPSIFVVSVGTSVIQDFIEFVAVFSIINNLLHHGYCFTVNITGSHCADYILFFFLFH